MLLILFSQLVQQIMPLFVTQRSLYEARERPSKTYSWKAFVLSNILVELPWATLGAVVLFFCWYYPLGLYQNATYTDSVTSRGGLEFLFVWEFILFSSTFAHLMIAGIETAEAASNLANVLFSLSLLFCGVLVGPTAMPGFWIFMYRVSPFTYLVEGLLGNGVANAPVTCAPSEFARFDAPSGQNCGEYLEQYISAAGGYLEDPNSTSCQLCGIDNTNTFLSLVNISFDNRWRNFGILFVYIIFNVFAATFIYWLARVPKGKKFAGKDKDGKKGLVQTKSTSEDGEEHSQHVVEKTARVDDTTQKSSPPVLPVEQTISEKPSSSKAEEPSSSVGIDAESGRPEPQRFVTAKEF